MTPTDIIAAVAELRKLAEQATPGSWWTDTRGGTRVVSHEGLYLVDAWPSPRVEHPERNAAYIAAANPKAILSLLAAAELGARTLEMLSGAEESGCIKSVYAETARLARNLNLLPGPSPEK